jgi:hypothetical protein
MGGVSRKTNEWKPAQTAGDVEITPRGGTVTSQMHCTRRVQKTRDAEQRSHYFLYSCLVLSELYSREMDGEKMEIAKSLYIAAKRGRLEDIKKLLDLKPLVYIDSVSDTRRHTSSMTVRSLYISMPFRMV